LKPFQEDLDPSDTKERRVSDFGDSEEHEVVSESHKVTAPPAARVSN
jgi:hypothetical protein